MKTQQRENIAEQMLQCYGHLKQILDITDDNITIDDENGLIQFVVDYECHEHCFYFVLSADSSLDNTDNLFFSWLTLCELSELEKVQIGSAAIENYKNVSVTTDGDLVCSKSYKNTCLTDATTIGEIINENTAFLANILKTIN